MKYSPQVATDDPYREELERVGTVTSLPTVDAVIFAKLSAQPSKYQDGTVVYADGTNWNPGAGAGLYLRDGGAWNKL
jgi:hypothetical protein